MDMFFGILNLFWQIISSLSVIVTLFCFVYPEGAYPIISFVFNKIKERRLKVCLLQKDAIKIWLKPETKIKNKKKKSKCDKNEYLKNLRRACKYGVFKKCHGYG